MQSFLIGSKRIVINIGLAAMLVIGLIPLTQAVHVQADTGTSLQNLSFEDELLNWEQVEPVADSISVITTIDEFTIDNKGTSVNVTPLLGKKMLRLGTPKNISEKQVSGGNTVRQTFSAEVNSITIAFRLFSWEFRGDDTFHIDIQDQDGLTDTGLDVVLSETIADESLPIQVSLDGGKRGDLLDTGWVRAKINGLNPDSTYTLVYSVVGGENNAHATWAYFDDGNLPPDASFDYYPASPWEGDIIELVDTSTDPDGDDIVSWDWRVTFNGIDINKDGEDDFVQSDLKNPVLILSNESDLDISLTVRDSNGAYDIEVKENVYVSNAPPSVNALNVQYLPGSETIDLFGRFIDPGWTDTHYAQWSIDYADGSGDNAAGTVTEENIPYMGTGFVSDIISLEPGKLPIRGTLTIGEIDGVSDPTIVEFDITVYGSTSDESNNTIQSAIPVTGDNIILSYIQEIGDVDIYTLGPDLPAGTDVLVNLNKLPADYDLIILSDSSDILQQGGFQMGGFQMGGYQMGAYQMGGYQMGGFQMGAYQMGGYQMGAFQMGAYQMGGFQMGGFQMGAYQMGGFQMGGFQMGAYQMGAYQMGAYQMGGYQMGGSQMGHYPLSQIGFTEGEDRANDNVGSVDISFNELGLSLSELGADNNIHVAGFSANSGIANETLLTSIDQAGSAIYIVVVGANDAYNTTEPYSLQIETSGPLDIQQLLTQWGAETYTPPVQHPVGDTQEIYDTNVAGDIPNTLFVTQRERIEGRYGVDSWNSLVGKITDLNNDPSTSVVGDILSIPISWYETWDNDYSDISGVNKLAGKIRGEIQDYLNLHDAIKYVVIMGNDDITPFFRSPDETSIGNERQYALSSYIKPGSPIFYSLLNGYILTDDYYVDASPIPWQGRSLFLPDISIARLVETPGEMIEAINQFIENHGILKSDTALVTGYDGFVDGASAAKTTLEGHSDVDSLMTDTWTSDELAQEFLGPPAHNIDNINAHYTHFSALAAYGSSVGDYSDILTSIQIEDANILDSIFFTMGCHAGLNVPYEAALDGKALGLDISPQLDFAQAMNKSIVLGSTGFGYFDDEDVGGTERLMGIFIDKLLNNGTITVGDALVNAKHDYLASSSAWTVYDEKSTIQYELYGLPQYKVEGGQPLSSNQLDSTLISANSQTTSSDSDLTITPSFILTQTEAGSYYSSDGDYQSTAFRPIQPRVVIDGSSLSGDGPIHGLVLVGGTFIDEDDFDPVITRPTNDWELDAQEAQLLPATFWPSELVKINNLETATTEVEQTIIITPGQFQPTGTNSEKEVIGVERRYIDLSFNLTSSDSPDFTPPAIESIDIFKNKNGTVNITIEANDESGIDSIVILSYANDTVSVVDNIAYTHSSETGEYTVTINNPEVDAALAIQVVDRAGNVAFATSKGNNMKMLDINVTVPPEVVENAPFTLSAEILHYSSLIETGPVFFTWDLGDGTVVRGSSLDDKISDNGIIQIQHTYPGLYPPEASGYDIVNKLKVTDSTGGIGNVVSIVKVLEDWWTDNASDPYPDPNGDLDRATMGNNDTDVTIILEVTGNITDDYQYRVTVTTPSGDKTLIKYSNGSITGVKAIDFAGPWEGTLIIKFALSELGNVSSGDVLEVYFETQAGVKAKQQEGFPDRMPDEGVFYYTVN